MSVFAVWLDHEHAKVFKITADDVTHETLKNKTHDHHTHNKDNKADHKHGSDHLFQDLTQKLNSADRVLIIGPGLAKDHFKSHLEKHHKANIAKKIIGTQTVDHMTDNQILAWVRDYFKHEFHS